MGVRVGCRKVVQQSGVLRNHGKYPSSISSQQLQMIITLRMVLGGFSRPPSIKAAQILLPPLFHIQPVFGARNTRGLRFFNVGRAWSLKENARLWPILAHYGPFCEFTHFFVCFYSRLNNVKVFQN